MEADARWYHRPWAVLLMLFVVAGPLGLPLLWRSPSFSRGMKAVLTALTVAYTLVLVGETFRAGRLALATLRALN